MTTQEQTIIEQQFDSFCKAVIRNAALDFYRAYKRLVDREIAISQLSKATRQELFREEFGASDPILFWVPTLNMQVEVQDERLSEALKALAPSKLR